MIRRSVLLGRISLAGRTVGGCSRRGRLGIFLGGSVSFALHELALGITAFLGLGLLALREFAGRRVATWLGIGGWRSRRAEQECQGKKTAKHGSIPSFESAETL
ncbi:hypothetical protein [Asaia platycodi]|uniref:hypothetical protein n=1 Tax=Asaia platycodi TaxID=610243 RepID=UPI0004720E0B|nr:hypothetical protein [Asaia platycodi]